MKPKHPLPNPNADHATRLGPKFYSTGIGLFPFGYPGEMGFPAEDTHPEEPIH